MDKFWQTMQDVNSKLWKLYLTHIPSHPTTRSLWWLPLHMCPLFLNHQFCRYLQSGLPKIPKIPLLCSRPHYRLPFSPKAQSPWVSRQSRGHRDLIWCPRGPPPHFRMPYMVLHTRSLFFRDKIHLLSLDRKDLVIISRSKGFWMPWSFFSFHVGMKSSFFLPWND